MLVEHDLVVGEGGARQAESDVGGRLDGFVPWVGRHEHDELAQPELLLRAPGELDVPAVRWVERAAVETDQASSNSSSPISTVAPSFAPAARSARSSSSSDGRAPR